MLGIDSNRAEIDRQKQSKMEQSVEGEIPVAVAAEQPMTILDYARPNMMGVESSILRPTVVTNNFEIKMNII